VELALGDRSRHIDLTRASRVEFEADESLAPATGIVSLRKGRFVRPVFSRTPVTSFFFARRGGNSVESLDTTSCSVDIAYQTSLLISCPSMNKGSAPVVQLSVPIGQKLQLGRVHKDPQSRTQFVIWETSESLSVTHRSKSIAVDFADGSETGMAGSLRLNSSYR
jgi:hypothetical protein